MLGTSWTTTLQWVSMLGTSWTTTLQWVTYYDKCDHSYSC